MILGRKVIQWHHGHLCSWRLFLCIYFQEDDRLISLLWNSKTLRFKELHPHTHPAIHTIVNTLLQTICAHNCSELTYIHAHTMEDTSIHASTSTCTLICNCTRARRYTNKFTPSYKYTHIYTCIKNASDRKRRIPNKTFWCCKKPNQNSEENRKLKTILCRIIVN